jgi:tetratricopeptide (TPR) repeat protein
MERLDNFVAGALLQRLRLTQDDESVAACASFRGAVLFVDISDYTALAETLCGQGANGVEQLGQTLDRAFRAHVGAVEQTGGEIACFAGDAFIAYWAADDGNVSRALGRAHECAGLLHAASRLPASSSTPSPSLHIGVGAGEMWAARLGGDGRWQLLLAGRAVLDACAASVRASAGETVVASAAGPFAAPSQGDTSVSTGTAANESVPAKSPTPAFGSLVPRRVQEFAGEGYAAWIPQRRTICALFVRLDGLDDTAPNALSQHQAVVTSLHVALRPYTGSSGTLLLDDKGLVFTLCFGMPHDAHADDALRAIRAGLAVRVELARLGFDCAIGVAAGPGVCMPLGGPPRRHYWAVGRFMHIAGRLMEAAGSGLLCTEEVADRVRRVVSLTPERPLALKGLRWPLRAFRVREAADVNDDAGVLYGREDEQAALDEGLDRFENGRGTALWLVGEAGLGKTALVHYLRQEAARRRITCLSGGAGSVEIDVPYVAWRPVFAALLNNASALQPTSQAERRERLGSIRHPQLASLINAVIPGFLEETPLAHGISGQARADATASVLSEVLASHATSRFVLVLEDCHWMDSASWRLLLRVVQDYPGAFIVLTSRPTVDVQELSALRRLEAFAEMPLSPLRPAAIGLLVESVLGHQSSDQALVDEITKRAVGNPLFAREYALLLTTDPHRESGSRHVARPLPAGSDTVPVTVRSLIASRLDALPPSDDLALKAASVIGDRFTVDLLAGVYPGDPHGKPLDTILESLTERQLIAPEGIDKRNFVFPHALIREVTYEQLTREQRRHLHRRAAETIERERRSDLRQDIALLAHHWSHAEVPDFAMEFSDRAASQALAAGAFEEADRLLSTCIQLAKDQGPDVAVADRIRWYRQVADARHGMGQLESRSAAAHHALRLAGRSRSHSSMGLLVQATGQLWRMKIGRALPAAWQVADTSQTLDVARAYRHSAEVCYFNNDMLGMICDSVSAVACASSQGPSAVLAGASTELGGILSIAGLRRIGERILQRSIVMAEAANDQAAQAYAHMISCLYYVGVGDWRSAERSAQRCQELCEPMDDRVNWTNAQAVRFWMSHYRSHEAAAYDAASSLRDRAGETGNRQHRAWAFRFLALCSLRSGEAREAAIQLQAGLECLGETAALNERIPTLGILALAQLRNGDVWSARATAREGLAQVVRVRRPIGHSTLEGYSSLLTVALDAWNEERSPQWKQAVRKCLQVLARYRKSFPVGEPRYQLHRGDYRKLSGATAGARRSYRRGEAAASRLGMPWEARRCKEALADLPAGR